MVLGTKILLPENLAKVKRAWATQCIVLLKVNIMVKVKVKGEGHGHGSWHSDRVFRKFGEDQTQ